MLEIWEEIGVSYSSAQNIIRKELDCTKVSARSKIVNCVKNEGVCISQLLLGHFRREGNDFLHKMDIMTRHGYPFTLHYPIEAVRS